jgi:hypothetical protein
LPDGLFACQKSLFGYIFEGFGMENIGIVYGHREYCMAIWYILLALGMLWYVETRKIWQPWPVPFIAKLN